VASASSCGRCKPTSEPVWQAHHQKVGSQCCQFSVSLPVVSSGAIGRVAWRLGAAVHARVDQHERDAGDLIACGSRLPARRRGGGEEAGMDVERAVGGRSSTA
jgi:hypothetical protein